MHACTDVDQDQPDVADQTIACTETNRAAVVLDSPETPHYTVVSLDSHTNRLSNNHVDQDQPDVADQTIACTETNRAAVI